MTRKKHFLFSLLISLALTACNDGSENSTKSESHSNKITGVVTAPRGAVVFYQNSTWWDNLLPSSAYAAITGLNPVGNGSISLIRVDDSGMQVGDILATTLTSSTGHYELSLPNGVSFASNLVLQIIGQHGRHMRALVVSNQVDLNPISDYVFQKLIDHGEPLNSFSIAHVIALLSQVNASSFAATGDMDSMLALIEQSVGNLVEQSLSDIVSGVPTATHREMYFGIGLQDQTNNTAFGYYSEIWQQNVDLQDPLTTNRQWIFSHGKGYWGLMAGRDSQDLDEYYMPVGYEADSDRTVKYETALSSGSFRVDWTTDIEKRSNLAWQTAARTAEYYKVPDKNIYFSSDEKETDSYEMNNDVIDYGSKVGYGLSYGLRSLAKMPTDMAFSDLNGRYGLVEIESNMFSDGEIEIESIRRIITFNGSNVTGWEGQVNGVQNTRYGNSENEEMDVYGNYPARFEFDVSANGNIAITGFSALFGGAKMTGFVSDDYSFLALSEYMGFSHITSLSKMGLAVKLPDTTPRLASRSYRLLFLQNEFYDGTKIKLAKNDLNTTISWIDLDNGTINYDTNEMGVSGLGPYDKISFPTSSESSVVRETVISDTHEVTIKAEVYGDEYKLVGYFNDTGSLGVFTSEISNDPFQGSDEIGIAILVETDN